jgi:hypothetical protein
MRGEGYELSAIPPRSYVAPGDDSDKKQAVADVACKESVGLTDTYITRLFENERAEIAAHKADLDAFAEWGKERLRVAAKALEGG